MPAEENLSSLGLELPEPFVPAGNYIPAVLTGNLLFTAGQVSRKGDDFAYQGIVGDDLTLEDGQEAAKLCCLGGLAVAKRELGSLDRIKRVVKINGFVRKHRGAHPEDAGRFAAARAGDGGRPPASGWTLRGSRPRATRKDPA